MAIVIEALKNLLRRPSTIQYPREPTPVEKDFRGKHYADLRKCIGCSICAIECPSNCITMKKLPEGIKLKHNPRGLYPVIEYNACVFCYRCVKVCPVDAYITTNDYMLSTKEKLLSESLSLSTLEGVSK